MSGLQHLTVAQGEGGQRLDRWFRRRFPHLTQGAIEKMLRKGEIRIDGARVKASCRIAEGQVIRVPPLPAAEHPVPSRQTDTRPSAQIIAELRRRIVHLDDDIMVIDKPTGLAVQGGTGQSEHVDGLLRYLLPDDFEAPRLVHRIDRDTSGLLVIARSREIAARLTGAFRGRSVHKIYHAAVAGCPSQSRGRIDLALMKGRDGAGAEKMQALESGTAGAQDARTDYAVMASVGNRASWVALRPATGRTHQLRAHLAAIGCPILGDGKYGGRERTNEGSGWGAGIGPALSRKLHLHAGGLAFAHPRSGKLLRLAAPLPEHMKATWKFFEWDLSDLAMDAFADD